MTDERLVIEIVFDDKAFQTKASEFVHNAAKLNGAEREQYLQTLGVVQRLKTEMELLKKAREQATDVGTVKAMTAEINRLNNEMRGLTAVTRQAADAGLSLKDGFMVGIGVAAVDALKRASSAVIEFGKSTIMAADNAENVRVSFETMLGSRQKAQQLLQEGIDLASNSPFELNELQNYQKQLIAVGIDYKEVTGDLKALGDVSAGVGKDKLPNLVLAFTEVSTAGKLSGKELRQFSQAGVPVLAELAKQSGKTMSQVREDIKHGLVDFAQVKQVFENLTSEGGRFYGLMEKQSKTLSGQLSNLSDNFYQLEVALGDYLLPTAKSFVSVLNDIVGAAKDYFTIPMSEKLKNEQTDLNGLVTAAVSVTDNYQVRSALISEITSKYPEFLRGIDSETVSNDQLIKRLKEVNKLYESRVASAFATEESDAAQKKMESRLKDALKAQSEMISELNNLRHFQGVAALNPSELAGLGREQSAEFLRAELARRTGELHGLSPEDRQSRLSGIYSMSRRASQPLDATDFAQKKQIEIIAKQEEAAAKLQSESSNLEGAKAEVEKLKAELLTASSNERKRGIQASIDRLEAQITPLETSVNEAKINNLEAQLSSVKAAIGNARTAFRTLSAHPEMQNFLKGDRATTQSVSDEIDRLMATKASLETQIGLLTPKKSGAGADGEDAIDKLPGIIERERDAVLQMLAKEQADIAKYQQKSIFTSVQIIEERVAAEIEAERKGLEKRKDAYIRNLIKNGMGAGAARSEANAQYNPLFSILAEKQTLKTTDEVDDFKKKVEQTVKDAKDKLDKAKLDASTERLRLQKDGLESAIALQNAVALQEAEKVKKTFDDLREKTQAELEKGFLSSGKTTEVAKAQAALVFADFNKGITAAEQEAIENVFIRNIEALRHLVYENLQKGVGELDRNLGIDKDKESVRLEERKQVLARSFLEGTITAAEFQKQLTDIERDGVERRLAIEIAGLNEQLKVKERALERSIILDKLGAGKTLTDDDRKKLEREIEDLKAQIAALTTQTITSLTQEKEEKIKKQKDYLQSLLTYTQSIFEQLSKIEIDHYNKVIDAQKTRVEQSKVLLERGNAHYYDAEVARLNKLERERERAVQRQQFIDRISQLSSISVGIAKAFADSGGNPLGVGVAIAASLSGLVAAYGVIDSIVPRKYARGTKYVEQGAAPSGIDTVPSMLTIGERVTDANTNAQYGGVFDAATGLSPKEAMRRLAYPTLTMTNGNAAASAAAHRDNDLVPLLSRMVELLSQKEVDTTVVKTNLDAAGFMQSTEKLTRKRQLLSRL